MIRIVRTDEHDDEILALDAVLFHDQTPLRIGANADCWAAFDGDTLVGYAVAYALADGTHYLDRYGVSPDHQGFGLGRRLLRCWLDEAVASGASHAWTYTYVHNASSFNALIAAGFRSWAPGVFPTTGEPQSERHCMWRVAL